MKTVWQTVWELNAGKGQALGLAGMLTLLLLTSGVLLAATTGRKSGRGPIPVLAWTLLLLTTALVFLFSFRQPLFHPRFLQIVLPVYLLLAAAGLSSLPRKWVGTALLAAAVLFSIPGLVSLYTATTEPDRGWEEAMGYLAAGAKAEDVVAFRGGQGFHPYWYYYKGPPPERLDLDPEEGLTELAAQATGARLVWLVAWDPLWTCEIPALFLPRAGDRLELAESRCFPAVVIASYAWREQESMPQ